MQFKAIIPARLKSTRFPDKILHPIEGVPMIEHVRRRAIMVIPENDVYVATCDEEIANIVNDAGGNVIMTSDNHPNGTSRIAEASKSIECSHVLLLQGDEPLLLPQHVREIAAMAEKFPQIDVFNATCHLDSEAELMNESHVKCSIDNNNRILYCFRKSPFISAYEIQKQFVRKLLGIFIFRKEYLLKLVDFTPSKLALSESIEQLAILEDGGFFHALTISPNLPSVNLPEDLAEVEYWLANDEEQRILLDYVKKNG